MLPRKYNVLLRTRMACKAILTNDLIFLTSNLHKNCVAHSYCVTNARVHKFNINTRNLSSTVDGKIVIDHEKKLVTLNTSINNSDVSLNLLTSIINDFEKNDSSISEISSLMLLHSCGSALQNEPLEIRQELVNRIWNFLKRRCKLTINHYHALLQSYIDNDQIIDQDKFLKDMTVTPEYDTYSLLLRVPNTNSSAFADLILSQVEENSLPIGPRICHSLMYAYATSGNVDNIMRTAQLMEEKNVNGLALLETYLMYAYAKSGNIEALTDALKKTELPVPHIMNLVKHLSLSKNGMYINIVLNHIQSPVKKGDFINTILQLVHADHVLDAYEIVTCIPIDEKLEDARETLLSQFLILVIKANKDQNTVRKIVNRIEEKYSYPDIWNKVIELAVEQKSETLAFKIFDEMKAMGVTLKIEHFHPLFLYIRKQGIEGDIYPVIKRMQALHVQIDTQTLVNYVFPCINLSNQVTTATKLCHHGVPSGVLIEPLTKYLIDSDRFVEGMLLCSSFRKKIDCQPILDSLYEHYKKTNNISICINFLFQMTFNGHGFAATFIKKFLNDPNKLEIVDDLYKFLIASKSYKATISIVDANQIRREIVNLNLSEDLKNRTLRLISSITRNLNDNCNTGKYIHPEYMNLEQLRAHFEELKTKSKNPRGTIRRLFIAACHQNQEELVNQLLKEVDKSKFNWTAGMRLSLFDHYVQSGKIEEALSELNEIQVKFKGFKIDNFKILRCATLLVKLDRINDALNVIDKCTSVNHKPDAHTQIDDLLFLMIQNNCNETTTMASNLVRRGYYTDTLYAFRYLILAQILKGDVRPAIVLFSNCVKQFNKTPGKQEVLIQLMKLNSNSSMKCDDLVDQVYDLIRKVHGRSVADVNLLIAFTLCDRVSETQKLLKSGNIKELLVARQFGFLQDEDIVKSTLGILKAFDSESTISLELLCNMALSICDNRGDMENAMKLQREMKEKNVKIDESLQKIPTKLLKATKYSVLPNMIADKIEVNEVV